MSDYLTLRMGCVICEVQFDHEVAIDPHRRGQSVMTECPVCASWTAEPTTRPYRLGLNDQRLLRSMRIRIDAEDVTAGAQA